MFFLIVEPHGASRCGRSAGETAPVAVPPTRDVHFSGGQEAFQKSGGDTHDQNFKPSPRCRRGPARFRTKARQAAEEQTFSHHRVTASPLWRQRPVPSAVLSTLQLASTSKKGGINGVKMTWRSAETEYNNAKGVECYERPRARPRPPRPDPSVVHRHLRPSSTRPADKIPADDGYGCTDVAGRLGAFPWSLPLVTLPGCRPPPRRVPAHRTRKRAAAWLGKKVFLSRQPASARRSRSRPGSARRCMFTWCPRRPPWQRAGRPVAAHPPGAARPRDFLGLGGDEP